MSDRYSGSSGHGKWQGEDALGRTRPRARLVQTRREKRLQAAEAPERQSARMVRQKMQPAAPAAPLQQQVMSVPRSRFPVKTVVTLLLVLIAAVLVLASVRSSLHRLRAQREKDEADYLQLVQRHTVAYRDWIERYSLENGIEPAFAAAVILRESSYDPRATSSVGARGLMQLMPDTFEQVRSQLRENATFDDMYDPEQNIRYGCWYLGYLC
ncbi:MAG: lytic transglycosylase domain-containing protein, partial [Clostridia bacterium]|nr:lytic transglycosylase domain-containing protein [Clostridia bacterium]